MSIANIGEVAWYVTGRFYSSAPTSLLEDVGYFLHLQGLDAPLFDGEPSEGTADFTFASDPFGATTVVNGGLNIGVDATGGFRIYLREHPGASFEEPQSFALGQCIATFQRVAIVPTIKITTAPGGSTVLSNVFTARLVSSEPFDFAGTTHNLRDLLGYGVTQWGTAATEPIEAPAGYELVVPFVGSAVRVGG
jgi:hypothetical protein